MRQSIFQLHKQFGQLSSVLLMAADVASFKPVPARLNLILGHARPGALPQGALAVFDTLVSLLGHFGQVSLHLLLSFQGRLFTFLNTERNLRHLSIGVFTAGGSTLVQTPLNPPQAASVNLHDQHLSSISQLKICEKYLLDEVFGS